MQELFEDIITMMTNLWILRMKLNLTMLLRIMLEESFDINLARVISMVFDEHVLRQEAKLKLRTNLKMYLRK